jgi:hypothetical protein
MEGDSHTPHHTTHTHTHFTFILQSTKPIINALVLAKKQVILIVLSANMRIKIVPHRRNFFRYVNCDLTFLID